MKNINKTVNNLTQEEIDKQIIDGEKSVSVLEFIKARERGLISDYARIAKTIKEEEQQNAELVALARQKYVELSKIASKETFFNLDHINALNIPYDVLIVLGKKNIGKTKQIYRLFREAKARGEKCIYMRYAETGLIGVIKEFKENPVDKDPDLICPFLLVNKNKQWELIDKETNEHMGIAIDFKRANSISGPEYEGYYTIIFDECVDYDVKDTLKQQHFFGWTSLGSTVTRSKERGVKLYMFGNNIVQDPQKTILKYYSINPMNSKFKIIQRGRKHKCNILYVNVGHWYKGIEEQPGLAQHMSAEFADAFYENVVQIMERNIIDDENFNIMNELCTFIIEPRVDKDPMFIVELRDGRLSVDKPRDEIKISAEEDDYYCAMNIRVFKPFYKYEHKTLTDNRQIANQHPHLEWRKSLEQIKRYIFFQIRADRMLYTGKAASEMANILYKEYDEFRIKKLEKFRKR